MGVKNWESEVLSWEGLGEENVGGERNQAG